MFAKMVKREGCKMKKISLKTFIKEECCNYFHIENRCIWIEEDFGDGKWNGFDNKQLTGGCFVMNSCRCKYFENVVFKICDPEYPYSHRQDCYEKLLKEYRKIHPKFKEERATKSNIRKCKCGNILPPRRRLCDKCRDDNNRKNKRDWKRDN